MRDFDRLLPDDLLKSAVMCGEEAGFLYGETLCAISIATNHLIAILGLESFELIKDGFKVISYSGYDSSIPFSGDWKEYVFANNAAAEHWAKENRLGDKHVYILTSASEAEFMSLPGHIK